eukprot:CAMPEP_0202889718 /NCGR_PEP_ID=MMETSP1392-20130828/313_1 /ASSEMBLY_ACC=CAM_ASM_000868 /TAXON_ID=225041 /ORGANISM="Chlamydomonas chlamydogama, Strain SAG 11-48b" /LENGTH=155 /DNA_ID=CAMNT_0049573117 /DNA_START=498 /DNA_END=965 /DNA_ORIENTATION=-
MQHALVLQDQLHHLLLGRIQFVADGPDAICQHVRLLVRVKQQARLDDHHLTRLIIGHLHYPGDRLDLGAHFCWVHVEQATALERHVLHSAQGDLEHLGQALEGIALFVINGLGSNDFRELLDINCGCFILGSTQCGTATPPIGDADAALCSGFSI